MRKVVNINRAWKFSKEPCKNGKPPKRFPKKWQSVDLPHTWNNLDGQDGNNDFYRGICVYCKEVESGSIIDTLANIDKTVYLELKGANSSAKIFVNGCLAGCHEGGFSTYRCDISHLIKKGRALITIEVDNSKNDYIYPQMADFTFFGGLYRDVNLIIVEKTHFSLEYFGSNGIKVTPILNEDGSADVECEAYVQRAEQNDKVKFTIGQESKIVSANDARASFHIENPILWNGRIDPHLYTLKSQLMRKATCLDEVDTSFGIRSFKVDPEKGFILNGKPYALRGVSRHQDRLNKGWAISQRDHREDMELIRDLGANTIRLAHYQHDQYFYDLCDEYGMVVWAEIPFISTFMKGEKAEENTLSQMKELIIQNYNHPSIACWGIANEITIGGESPELKENLIKLNNMCHELDKTRLTTIASLSMLEMDSELNKITDILSYNHYFGWYLGETKDNEVWLDEFHKKYPNRCIGLSEYGCEGVTAYHTDEPRIQDYTEEYQAYYHEKMLEIIQARPYLWATHVWNMFDFASDIRDEGGMKGRNNKGLVTYDRKIKKDSYYIYKAYWSDKPFVHICSKRYIDRTSKTIDIKVYSNCKEVTLFVNSKEYATLEGDKIFIFKNVPLDRLENSIVARSEEQSDAARFRVVEKENEAYKLENAQTDENAKNWFVDKAPDGRELKFNDDCFSIKDKLGDIMKCPEGRELINDWIKRVGDETGVTLSKGMLNMIKNFTIEKAFQMAGDRVPVSLMFDINEKLIEIRKPK